MKILTWILKKFSKPYSIIDGEIILKFEKCICGGFFTDGKGYKYFSCNKCGKNL